MLYINTILLTLSFIYLFKINRDNYYADQQQQVKQHIQQTHDIYDSDYAILDDENWIGIVARKHKLPQSSANPKQHTDNIPKTNPELHEEALKPIEQYKSRTMAK